MENVSDLLPQSVHVESGVVGLGTRNKWSMCEAVHISPTVKDGV